MKTECKRGHDLTDPANVKTKPNGERQCKPCAYASGAAWRKRKREELGIPERPPRLPADKTDCSVEGCDRDRHDTGSGRLRYCFAHHWRLKTHGDLYEDVPVGRGGTARGLKDKRAKLRGVQA